MLQQLSIDLSTSPLTWVKEFVDPPNCGHQLIIRYLQMVTSTVEDDESAAELGQDRCIVCVKALMNNAYGFQCVFAEPNSIDVIAFSMRSRSLKIKCVHAPRTAAACAAHPCDVGALNGWSAAAQDHGVRAARRCLPCQERL